MSSPPTPPKQGVVHAQRVCNILKSARLVWRIALLCLSGSGSSAGSHLVEGGGTSRLPEPGAVGRVAQLPIHGQQNPIHGQQNPGMTCAGTWGREQGLQSGEEGIVGLSWVLWAVRDRWCDPRSAACA